MKLHAPLADMRERIPPMAGQLEAIDERTCLLQASAFSLESLVAWIAGIGVDFDVREPPELVAHMERVANLLLRATTRAQGEASGRAAQVNERAGDGRGERAESARGRARRTRGSRAR